MGFDYHKFRVLYKTKYIKIEIQREMQINKEREEKRKKEQIRLEKIRKREEEYRSKR